MLVSSRATVISAASTSPHRIFANFGNNFNRISSVSTTCSFIKTSIGWSNFSSKRIDNNNKKKMNVVVNSAVAGSVAAQPLVDADALIDSVETFIFDCDDADVLLWRNKKKSAAVFGVTTIIWALFEMIEYHLLSLVCHLLILVLGVHFLWSNTLNLIYKCPQFPQVALDEDTVLRVASALRHEINNALEDLRQIASGKDLKKFLAVIAGLWVVSIAGSCCNLLTLIYICFVLLHTVPALYERHKDQADIYLEKGEAELKKQFEVLQEKVLSKVPGGQSKDKKHA